MFGCLHIENFYLLLTTWLFCDFKWKYRLSFRRFLYSLQEQNNYIKCICKIRFLFKICVWWGNNKLNLGKMHFKSKFLLKHIFGSRLSSSFLSFFIAFTNTSLSCWKPYFLMTCKSRTYCLSTMGTSNFLLSDFLRSAHFHYVKPLDFLKSD